ncbi:MAG: TldD/PmbA family protein [Candidatus Thorarchaeota archaeon]|jgi:PmbA protein
MKEKLLEIAESAVKMAEKLGASQAEAYVGQSRAFAIEAENSAIRNAETKRDAGIGIRTVIDRKIGFAFVTTLSDEDVREAVEMSVKLAKASIPDPEFVSLPLDDNSYPTVKGLFNKNIAELPPEATADMIIRVIDASKQVLEGRDYAISAGVQSSSGMNAVVNSLGIAFSEPRSSILLYSSPVVKETDDQTRSVDYQITRNLGEIDPEHIGESAAKLTLSGLGPKTIEGGEMPVVFAPKGVGTVIGRGFAGAVYAEEVQKGRSYITDAFGDTIASKHLEIVDDALLTAGLGSRTFDAEGYPSQRTSIIEGGVLKGLLHNSYTANKDDVKNTGNASRPSYSGLPSISTSNLIISPGKGTLEDLVSEIDRGVLCRNTADRPNMTTGDLSAMLYEGFYIERCEIQHPLKNTLVGINMRDLLQRISRVGSDTKTTLTMITPSIVVEKATVTSG